MSDIESRIEVYDRMRRQDPLTSALRALTPPTVDPAAVAAILDLPLEPEYPWGQPCSVCGAITECDVDADGRPMIHATADADV